VFDWLFRNRETGEVTIAQAPNPPLIVFLVAWMLRWVLGPEGGVLTGLNLVAGVAIVWWAGDEVVRGVNPWRRILGLGTLALVGIRVLR
jgi:hypothetical protein